MFILKAVDVNGEPVEDGGDPFSAVVERLDGKQEQIMVELTDMMSGQYAASFHLMHAGASNALLL